jgi:hypothetical protein
MSEQKKDDAFENMMNMYEESHKPKPSTGKKYDIKNYFSSRLEQNEKEAIKTIRILPPPEGKKTFYDVLWGHTLQLTDGSWKTFPCLDKEEGKPCPFCEANQALYASGKESDKELAKKYRAKKMYIVKVIERENEDHGVKFWRFNYSWTKDGTLDKIMEAMKAVNHDITNPNTGRDLRVKVSRNQFNTPVVNSITYPLETSPLTSNIEAGKSWLADDRTWRDVYSTRDYNYCSIIVKGHTPMWDKTSESFVSKEEFEKTKAETESENNYDDELNMSNPVPTVEATPSVETTTETVTPTPPVEEDDDLPF